MITKGFLFLFTLTLFATPPAVGEELLHNHGDWEVWDANAEQILAATSLGDGISMGVVFRKDGQWPYYPYVNFGRTLHHNYYVKLIIDGQEFKLHPFSVGATVYPAKDDYPETKKQLKAFQLVEALMKGSSVKATAFLVSGESISGRGSLRGSSKAINAAARANGSPDFSALMAIAQSYSDSLSRPRPTSPSPATRAPRTTQRQPKARAQARSNEGAVVLCARDVNEYSTHFTIALGIDMQQARSNARFIMPDGCFKKVECEGGYYAIIRGHNAATGMACGYKTRREAVEAARDECLQTGGADCYDSRRICISGRTNREYQKAEHGTVWMGNYDTERHCEQYL